MGAGLGAGLGVGLVGLGAGLGDGLGVDLRLLIQANAASNRSAALPILDVTSVKAFFATLLEDLSAAMTRN